MRLFAAIRPPAPVLEHLDAALAPLREGVGQRLRWVPAEQWHLTVAFYGQVPDGAALDVQEALAAAVAGWGSMQLSLHGAGSFSARNLWVGVSGEVARLRALMVECARAPLTEDDSHRAPRPHLTVARVGRRARELDVRPLARALAVYSGPDWTTEEVRLVRSRLGEGPGGAVAHEVIGSVEL